MLINVPQNYITGKDFSGELYFTNEETEAQEDEVP